MEHIGPGVVAVISGVIGLAIVAVIVSRNAQTPSVLSSAGSALSQVIGAAVAPVTGNSFGGSGAASIFGGPGA